MKACQPQQRNHPRRRPTQLPTRQPLAFGLLMTLSTASWAQSTPAEFAELSLMELFHAPAQQAAYATGSWQFGYHYDEASFEGYRDGTQNLSNDQVLWQPGEVRTDSNYPVVPTQIKQRVHKLNIGHQLNKDWHLQASLPYIEQATDHISIVPGYETFTIESRGVGDVNLIATRNISDSDRGLWWLSAGVSLPTGSIDEKGDTPRGAGIQQLPYTMQLGSGTYDLPLQIAYRSFEQNNWKSNWDLSLSAKLRFGRNDRDYRLGNHYAAAASKSLRLSDWLTASLGGDLTYIEKIKGADKSILLTLPYPASITDPNNYGGVTGSMRARLSVKPSATQEVLLEAGMPVYQDLNGPQPKAQWNLRLGFNYAL